MIQHERDVADALGSDGFGDAQHEVPILAAVETGPQPAGVPHALGSKDGQVTDVVLADEEIRVPVGFEMRIVAPAVLIQMILVRVNQLGIRMGGDLGGDHVKGVRCQRIIMIEEGDVLAAGHGERAVRCGDDAAVVASHLDTDPRIGGGGLGEDRRDLRAGRGIIGDAEVPIRINLRPDRRDRRAEMRRIGVVDRHYHRDARPRRQCLDMPADRLLVVRPQRIVGCGPFPIGLPRNAVVTIGGVIVACRTATVAETPFEPPQRLDRLPGGGLGDPLVETLHFAPRQLVLGRERMRLEHQRARLLRLLFGLPRPRFRTIGALALRLAFPFCAIEPGV